MHCKSGNPEQSIDLVPERTWNVNSMTSIEVKFPGFYQRRSKMNGDGYLPETDFMKRLLQNTLLDRRLNLCVHPIQSKCLFETSVCYLDWRCCTSLSTYLLRIPHNHTLSASTTLAEYHGQRNRNVILRAGGRNCNLLPVSL